MSVQKIAVIVVSSLAKQGIFSSNNLYSTQESSLRLILEQVGHVPSPIKRQVVAALQAVIAKVTAAMAEEAQIQKP